MVLLIVYILFEPVQLFLQKIGGKFVEFEHLCVQDYEVNGTVIIGIVVSLIAAAVVGRQGK